MVEETDLKSVHVVGKRIWELYFSPISFRMCGVKLHSALLIET